MSNSIRSRLRYAVEALAYTGLWTAAAAGALVWTAARSVADGITNPDIAFVCALTAAGTVVVYSLDRLRDLDRDASTSPLRTAFVAEHRGAVAALVFGASVVCLAVAWTFPIRAWALCGGVLIVGLLHRRIKANRVRTLAYVTGCWVAIVVGLPALLAGPDIETARLVGTTAGLALAIGSNAIASQLRGVRFDSNAAIRLRGARRAALASCAICLAVPGVRSVAMVGAATWIGVLFFRSDERYGLVALDGALLVGAIGAALSMTASAG